jgi:hypothetical protein
MAHRREKYPADESPESKDLSRLHVEYNLETDPLQTGIQQPRTDLTEKARLACRNGSSAAAWLAA